MAWGKVDPNAPMLTAEETTVAHAIRDRALSYFGGPSGDPALFKIYGDTWFRRSGLAVDPADPVSDPPPPGGDPSPGTGS